MQAPAPDAQAQLQARFRNRITPFVRKHAQSLEPGAAERLLRQFTPDAQELNESPGFNDDPLHEDDSDIHPFADVVHKYRTKILYLTTDECPVYCRYCTRKRRTLLSQGHTPTAIDSITGYLRDHPEVNEVIFSGGDPLMLPASDLFARARAFLQLETIRYLRFHTRALTTSPALLSGKFLAELTHIREQFPATIISFVLHINTAEEISTETRNCVAQLFQLGIRCYAQTVLLRNINDSSELLSHLCQSLAQAGIQPYYLHQLDRVTGSAHFEVSDAEAKDIWNGLRNLLPVYLLPRLVRDSKQGKYPL